MSAPIPNQVRAKIIADYTSGMQQRDVATKHSVGAATVNRIVNKAGVGRSRRLSPEIVDAAVQDYIASGDSIRAVASRHPLSEDTLRLELHRREVTRPSGATVSTHTREAAMDDYLDGMTVAAVAEKHSVPPSTVSTWIKAYGITADDRQRGESPTNYTHGWVRNGLVWRPVKPVRERAA